MESKVLNKLALYHYNAEASTEIKFDSFGRPFIQEYTEYDSDGNILKIGGRFMLPKKMDYSFTIQN